MSILWTELFRPRADARQTRRQDYRAARPGLEPMESRDLKTAGISWNPATHVLSIVGTSINDRVNVSIQNNQVKTTLESRPSGPDAFYVLTDEKSFDLSQVIKVSFTGNDGDD